MNSSLCKAALYAALLIVTGCRPAAMDFPRGDFADDYGITYSITDSTWHQTPRTLYRIVAVAEHRLLLESPATDSTNARFTRVDWLTLEDMAPWEWAYCYAVWDVDTASEALEAESADRSSPRDGCGGFPFSRMKVSE